MYFARGITTILIFAIIAGCSSENEQEGEREAKSANESFDRRRSTGRVELAEALVKNAGIEVTPAEAATWIERIPVYGRVVPNPKSTLDVRAPFAGVLHESEDTGWPQLGRHVRLGQTIGVLEIRVGPQERLELESKLKEARLRHQGAIEVEKVQRERVDRLRKLTSADIVSQRELADALVAQAEAQTQLSTTKSALELWTAATAQINEPTQAASRWRIPLTAPADGEVAQVLSRPGSTVEAGTSIVRITNFQQLLIRLDVPPELLSALPPLLSVFNDTGSSAKDAVEARLVGTAPQVDVASQLAGYWYEAMANSSGLAAWRPGLFIKALVTPADAKSVTAVAVPAEALLFHEGLRWVYVQTEPGKFQRRPIEPLGRDGAKWLIALGGVKPGEAVVSKHAQTLLSEELRTEVEED